MALDFMYSIKPLLVAYAYATIRTALPINDSLHPTRGARVAHVRLAFDLLGREVVPVPRHVRQHQSRQE